MQHPGGTNRRPPMAIIDFKSVFKELSFFDCSGIIFVGLENQRYLQENPPL